MPCFQSHVHSAGTIVGFGLFIEFVVSCDTCGDLWPNTPNPEAWCVPHSIFPKGDGLNSCTCPSNGHKDEVTWRNPKKRYLNKYSMWGENRVWAYEKFNAYTLTWMFFIGSQIVESLISVHILNLKWMKLHRFNHVNIGILIKGNISTNIVSSCLQ